MTDSKKIVDKAWSFAHVLRDDGLLFMAYTEQITLARLSRDLG
jgi:type I restriction enzyme M protein